MSKTEIQTTTKITVLKHLINDQTLAFVGGVVGLTVDQVRDVAANHGYPDPDKMQWAVDTLTKRLDHIPEKDARHLDKPAPRDRQAPPRDTDPHPPIYIDKPAPDRLQALAARAAKSPKAGTRTLGARLLSVADTLQARLDGEDQAAAERAAKRAAREAAAAKVAKLRAEIKKLESATRPDRDAEARRRGRRIRQWARDNGWDVADRGVMSPQIYVAYDKAHPGEAS